MKTRRTLKHWLVIPVVAVLVLSLGLAAQNSSFHNAPASAKQMKSPYEDGHPAAGKQVYDLHCAQCHGQNGEGSGNVPPLGGGKLKTVSSGELFWFITKGDINNGMPAWDSLSQQERWQVVSFVKSLGASSQTENNPLAAPAQTAAAPQPSSPPPTAPFTDYRFELPGKTRRITLPDLPAPYASKSAPNGSKVVARPEGAWPQVPVGFKVEQYAAALEGPRLIRTAPNGDFFVAESKVGDIRVFRGINPTGKPVQMAVFATGLKRPFGINFYPPGSNPQWIYAGNTDSVVRFPYQNGDLTARGPAEHVVEVPGEGSHWTRDIQFSPDGKKMFVSVGSASNIDDADTTPAEKNRADVLEFNPDGSEMRVYAYGIRNCVGLAVAPKTGNLWCSVNERDGLGDNLVPDYITHLQEGGYYGWPWWYMGGHQDPRHEGKHPELKDKVITPDVILQPHNASLELTFYDGSQFPDQYRGDIFAAEHGSWNRSTRVGYELIRVPLHGSEQSGGDYEDFMTGFVVDNEHVWGRPVGVAVAHDGSLLVTDDASNCIWRITYTGK